MAANTNVTLAKIRSGSAQLVSDSVTKNEQITAVQKALRSLGYYTKTLNKSNPLPFDDASVFATDCFQHETSITATGKLNKATLVNIDNSLGFQIYAGHSNTPPIAAIASGMDTINPYNSNSGVDSGNAVDSTRKALVKNGYSIKSSGAVDKAFTDAVVSFQKSAGLTADGIVGQQTYVALGDTNYKNWFSNNKITLTSGLLARCGFTGVSLRGPITDLNAALNRYHFVRSAANGKTAKELTAQRVAHFLAQACAETAYGASLVESTYYLQEKGKSYSPYYGGGFVHLTSGPSYLAFYNYMKNSRNINDPKIHDDTKYCTQHVAIKYPGESAGWYWDVYVKFNGSSLVNWSDTDENICKVITTRLSGSDSTTSDRYRFFKKIYGILL